MGALLAAQVAVGVPALNLQRSTYAKVISFSCIICNGITTAETDSLQGRLVVILYESERTGHRHLVVRCWQAAIGMQLLCGSSIHTMHRHMCLGLIFYLQLRHGVQQRVLQVRLRTHLQLHALDPRLLASRTVRHRHRVARLLSPPAGSCNVAW